MQVLHKNGGQLHKCACTVYTNVYCSTVKCQVSRKYKLLKVAGQWMSMTVRSAKNWSVMCKWKSLLLVLGWSSVCSNRMWYMHIHTHWICIPFMHSLHSCQKQSSCTALWGPQSVHCVHPGQLLSLECHPSNTQEDKVDIPWWAQYTGIECPTSTVGWLQDRACCN